MLRSNMIFKYLFIYFILTLFPTQAFSYFDPGSGSYLIQLFIAFIASCYFFIRNPIQFIKSFFNKNKKENDEKNKDNSKE